MIVSLSKKLQTENGFQRLSVSFRSYRGAWVGVIGPSGSGKTTLLKMMAGLCKPDYGMVKLSDRVLFDSTKSINIPPYHRRIGYVSQEPALFPFMTVLHNISYGCTSSSMPMNLLQRAGLEDLANRYPKNLSGGQKQRVSLLRAVASRPQCLLLDEPFSGLDETKKNGFKEMLISLYAFYKFDVVFVSHDIDEVNALCDVIVDVELGGIKEDSSTNRLRAVPVANA